MKLEKITAYQQIDGPPGEVITIIPSGFLKVWVRVIEDNTYNINVDYPKNPEVTTEILNAIKEAELDG